MGSSTAREAAHLVHGRPEPDATKSEVTIRKEAALALAAKTEELLLVDGAPLTDLNITRPVESRWGDRELEFMARALEHRPYDAELHGLLAARQLQLRWL